MPYWNKYPLRDRAGDVGKPAANLTSRGMGVFQRRAALVLESAEAARLAAEDLTPGAAPIALSTHKGTAL